MPYDLVIRRAQAQDATAVAEAWWRSRAAAAPAIPAPVHAFDDVRSWFADLVLPEREVWVAVTAAPPDMPDGVVALLVLDGRHLDQLYVDPSRQGAGIGSRLVALAQERRPDGLDLWTFQANLGARRFYERHGFLAVERTDGDNEEGAPDVRYAWPPSADDSDTPTSRAFRTSS